jgi:putative toxin-antitoxin system antitoxin component (TIGR02293 family)
MASKKNIKQLLDQEITKILNSPMVSHTGFPDQVNQINTVRDFTFDEFLSDKMLMIAVIRAGIPYSLFDLIQQYAPFSEAEWAGFMDVSTKSLQRYKQSAKRFKSIHSEKIIMLSEVTRTGLDVFGSQAELSLWLNTPNFALGTLKPIDLLKDSYGTELVTGEMIRIDHGIFV